MPTMQIAGRSIDVTADGFLTDHTQWDKAVAAELARRADIDLTDAHWAVIAFLRRDFEDQGRTPSLRRTSTVGGFPVVTLFELFPGKPAKIMAQIAGLPKSVGCV